MYLFNDNGSLGFRIGPGAVTLADLPAGMVGSAPVGMAALLADLDHGLDALRSLSERLEEAGEAAEQPTPDWRPGPVFDRPGKIICVGLNYRAHAAETGGEPPAHPVIFGKFANALAGHNEPVNIAGLERVDYEAELGLMIGRRAARVPESRALEHVLGWFNANDLSDRKLQFMSGQWLLGKSLPGFLPTGPWLRVHEPGFDPQDLRIRGWLNGEPRQDSTTADMIFSVAEIIAWVSRFIPLEPGDLIVTGTPEGVILGTEDRRWMQPGDAYAVEIEGLGRLENRLVGTSG